MIDIVRYKTKHKKMKRNYKTRFWTKKVWNWRWEMWLTYFMISIVYLISIYLLYASYLAPQPEFIYNLSTPAQTCHHYNDQQYCCFDYPEYTLYTNMSKNVTLHYTCTAVKIKTLKRPFIIGVEHGHDNLEYE